MAAIREERKGQASKAIELLLGCKLEGGGERMIIYLWMISVATAIRT